GEIAHRRQEIFVGLDDRTVELEGDHRLAARDRRDLAGIVGRAVLLRRDVGCELDDADWLAVPVERRIVARLQPHLAPALGEPPELARLVLTPPERLPERRIFGALRLRRIDEHPMMLPDDLIEPIAHRREEILVGCFDRPVEAELDHRVRAHDRRDPALIAPARRALSEKIAHAFPLSALDTLHLGIATRACTLYRYNCRSRHDGDCCLPPPSPDPTCLWRGYILVADQRLGRHRQEIFCKKEAPRGASRAIS